MERTRLVTRGWLSSGMETHACVTFDVGEDAMYVECDPRRFSAGQRVFLDLILPDGNGMRLCAQVRASMFHGVGQRPPGVDLHLLYTDRHERRLVKRVRTEAAQYRRAHALEA